MNLYEGLNAYCINFKNGVQCVQGFQITTFHIKSITYFFALFMEKECHLKKKSLLSKFRFFFFFFFSFFFFIICLLISFFFFSHLFYNILLLKFIFLISILCIE